MSAEPTTSDLRTRVDAIAHKHLRGGGTAGLVIGVVRDGKRHCFAYGNVAREGAPPGERTVFEIASITKAFTAVLLADMVARGEVTLDTRVNSLLPEGARMPGEADNITLRHLATHRSGLPRLPGNLWGTVKDMANPYAGYTVDHLHEYLRGCRLRRPPGSGYEYSNLGAGLLGHVLALRLGMTYEQAVKTRVCGPSGMADTGITLTEDQQQRMAQGHSEKGEPVPGWDFPSMPGGGALRSTVADMLTWLEANLGRAPETLKGVLNACHERQAGLASFHPVSRIATWGLITALIPLVLQGWLGVPGTGSVLGALAFGLPVVVASAMAGFRAGNLSALVLVAGAWFLHAPPFSNPKASGIEHMVGGALMALTGALISWFGSAGHRAHLHDGIGLGWHLQPLAGAPETVVWHNGGTGGFSSWTGFVKGRGTGVVVLANSAHSVDSVGIQALQAALEG